MKDKESPAVIADDGKDEQQQEEAAGFEIKEKADREKINGARARVFINLGVANKHYKKKGPEKKMREQQGLILRIGDYELPQLYGFTFLRCNDRI
jgi:hypothetical protein